MTRVVIISGGWSAEREVSLNSGRAVFEALRREKAGRFHVTLLDPRDQLMELFQKREDFDVAMVLLHGRYGEDGTMQGLLEILNIPFVGSGVLASAISMNKKITKQLYRAEGLEVPAWILVQKDEDWEPKEILERLGPKVVVKPVLEGSSIGISLCSTVAELERGVTTAMKFGTEVLVEKYIEGVELTCCVIGTKRPQTLPLIEIRPRSGYEFFNYEAKYKPGATEEICPAPVKEDIARVARECGTRAHKALGCKVWSRTDMIVQGGRPYLLETNTIPGMTETSLFPLAAKVAGLSLADLVEKLIELSLEEEGSAYPG